MLQVFFSHPWLWLARDDIRDDISFLCSLIEGEDSGGCRRDFLACILEKALISSEDADAESSTVGLPMHAMELLNDRIECTRSEEFASDGTRLKLPHFIPAWLVRTEPVTPLPTGGRGTYLDDFVHCFKGELSHVAFCMLLKRVVLEASGRTSEQLFLELEAGIKSETQLKSKQRDRLSRLRETEQARGSLRGSYISAMLLDARLIVFICTVAKELALSGQSTAFEGVHHGRAVDFLAEAMSTESLDLQSLFFATLVRIAGEMQAYSLTSQEPLSRLDWCKRWANGVPKLQEETRIRLLKAETELREFILDEERKSREWRLCPHCDHPFMVHARNCGNFVCGQTNPDSGRGRCGQGFGCGNSFHIDNAGTYKANTEPQGRLQSEIEAIKRVCVTRDEDSVLWKKALEMKVPSIWSGFQWLGSTKTIFPTMSVPDLEIGASSSVDLLSLLTRWRQFLPQLRILPDLIEVRMKWGDQQRAVAPSLTTLLPAAVCMDTLVLPLHHVETKGILDQVQGRDGRHNLVEEIRQGWSGAPARCVGSTTSLTAESTDLSGRNGDVGL